MKSLISEHIETNRIIIRNATSEDIDELRSVCESWVEKKDLEGDSFEVGYIEKCLSFGDLPPINNANKDNYRFKSICSKKNSKIIGFFDIYHGYPTAETIWISIFIIKNEIQQKGFGSEVIELISKEATEKKYTSIGIGVHLKNWKGIRFWSSNGFDKIKRISGDKNYSANNFSIMFLEKSI
ncbi:MAG: GNAT family N-acetyltransferase [Bacteroidales bacterium]|jgi:ribosomal protein S18 acetylase RimI-like enzyme